MVILNNSYVSESQSLPCSFAAVKLKQTYISLLELVFLVPRKVSDI